MGKPKDMLCKDHSSVSEHEALPRSAINLPRGGGRARAQPCRAGAAAVTGGEGPRTFRTSLTSCTSGCWNNGMSGFVLGMSM